MTIGKSVNQAGRMDRNSFEILFREYFSSLMAFARKILSDEDDAREVVHQVFVNLWEKRNHVDLSTSLKPYLFTSVHHRSLNMIRDRRKFSGGAVPDLAGEWDVSVELESMELEEKIREALQSLPEKCREVFELSRFNGMKYSEIASHLGISVKTVENQMSKALKILRERLLKYLTILMWLVLHALN